MAYFLGLGLEEQLAVQQTVHQSTHLAATTGFFCWDCEKSFFSSVSQQLNLSVMKSLPPNGPHVCAEEFPNLLAITSLQPWRETWDGNGCLKAIPKPSITLAKIFLPPCGCRAGVCCALQAPPCPSASLLSQPGQAAASRHSGGTGCQLGGEQMAS